MNLLFSLFEGSNEETMLKATEGRGSIMKHGETLFVKKPTGLII